jgi:hypothetical protein
LVIGIWLIPIYGKIGVAITASASFLASGAYLLYKMLNEPGITLSMLLPEKADISKANEFIKSFFGKLN